MQHLTLEKSLEALEAMSSTQSAEKSLRCPGYRQIVFSSLDQTKRRINATVRKIKITTPMLQKAINQHTEKDPRTNHIRLIRQLDDLMATLMPDSYPFTKLALTNALKELDGALSCDEEDQHDIMIALLKELNLMLSETEEREITTKDLLPFAKAKVYATRIRKILASPIFNEATALRNAILAYPILHKRKEKDAGNQMDESSK